MEIFPTIWNSLELWEYRNVIIKQYCTFLFELPMSIATTLTKSYGIRFIVNILLKYAVEKLKIKSSHLAFYVTLNLQRTCINIISPQKRQAPVRGFSNKQKHK